MSPTSDAFCPPRFWIIKRRQMTNYRSRFCWTFVLSISRQNLACTFHLFTRAIHLELVTDMTTEKFLLAFRRFVSRRGLCKTIHSDNAKTFKRADMELKILWNFPSSKETQEFFTEKLITWKFIAERAA